MSSSTRNLPSNNMGTLTVSGTNQAIWYIPAAPGVKAGAYGTSAVAPGYGLSADNASIQFNITGPLAGKFFLDGSVDGVNFTDITTPLNITLPLITDAHQNVTAKTDGVLSLYTKVPTFTALATTAISSTVGEITFLDSACQPVGVAAGDELDITGGADSGLYIILSCTSNAPNSRGNTSTGGTNSAPVVWTIQFTTATSLAGSVAPTALIYSGSLAGFSSSSGAFIANGVVVNDVLTITAGVNAGRFFPVVSGITASTLTLGTPGGIITAGTSQHFNVWTNAPYPNTYTVNLSGFGYPFLETGITASGLYGSASCFVAAK